jgi:hypothetical protein
LLNSSIFIHIHTGKVHSIREGGWLPGPVQSADQQKATQKFT